MLQKHALEHTLGQTRKGGDSDEEGDQDEAPVNRWKYRTRIPLICRAKELWADGIKSCEVVLWQRVCWWLSISYGQFKKSIKRLCPPLTQMKFFTKSLGRNILSVCWVEQFPSSLVSIFGSRAPCFWDSNLWRSSAVAPRSKPETSRDLPWSSHQELENKIPAQCSSMGIPIHVEMVQQQRFPDVCCQNFMHLLRILIRWARSQIF